MDKFVTITKSSRHSHLTSASVEEKTSINLKNGIKSNESLTADDKSEMCTLQLSSTLTDL